MPLEIRSALLCEGVRTEITGKHILIGVYTGDILFDRFPMKFSPTYWVEIKAFVQDAEMELEMKIEAPGIRKPRIHSGSLYVEKQETALFVLTIEPIEITGPGRLRLFMRAKGKRWTDILSKNIALRESALPAT